jgi:hypothetical protein
MQYTSFFCFYLVDVCTGFSPASSTQISPLCGAPRGTQESHFSHFVWILLFPRAEQTRQFIHFAKEFGQPCRLASSRWNIVNDRAGGRSNLGGGGGAQHIPACSSMSRARARRKSVCDSFAPQEDRMKLFRIIRSSKWRKSFFVHFQVRRLTEELFVILSPLSTYHTHKTERTLDLGHDWSGCLEPY